MKPKDDSTETAVLPMAAQRAPTLMAADVSGSQGEIRVWAPDMEWIREQIRPKWGQFWFIVAMSLLFFRSLMGVLWALSYPVGYYWSLKRALRRPCVITTDSAGVGITTSRGCRAFRWSEIIEAEWTGVTGCRLKAEDGSVVVFDLVGFSRDQCESFRNMVDDRADLMPYSLKWYQYMTNPGHLWRRRKPALPSAE